MTVNHVLAVAPVRDIDTARAWYERLFGQAPDNRPMDSLAEWRVTETGWLQVWQDADRAGHALVNFAVDDLEHQCAELAMRGLNPGSIETVNKGVRLSTIIDPDGNTITFIGNFRVEY